MTPSLPFRTTLESKAQTRDVTSRLRIIVLGYIVRGPIGGMAWHHLQYVLGLRRLGHDVLFIEDSDDYPSCYNPTTHEVGCDPTYGLMFAQQAFNRLGLTDQWAYYDAHQAVWHGRAASRALRWCEEADLLLNVSGVNPIRPWLEQIPVRMFIDTDPAFTQVRHLTDESAYCRAAQHNRFFSFAEAIRSEESDIPDDGLPWQATRQPVVLEAWPVVSTQPPGAFTTVMQWDSYPPLHYNGQRLGMKSESFDIVRSLPSRIGVPLELALGGATAPRHELRELGWRVVDPLAVTRDPWTYQEYLQGSLGEFSVAKHGYVVTRSGWFSERTACYLATGRPVVVQNTGFSRHLPCGAGLLAFDDAESAVEALHDATINHRRHSRAARDLAVTYFDSDKVLRSLIDRASSATIVTNSSSTNEA